MTEEKTSELPRISLVTPCLNQVDLIGKTLDSVLDQQYANLDYVVVDGASTDGSVEVIRARERHLSHWISEPDEGHYDALNKGFDKTSGAIMGYLNGDDVLLPGALALVAHIFTEFPEVEWLTGSHVAIDAAGRPVAAHSASEWSRWRLLSPRVTQFPGQESTFWRRGLWERAGGRMAAEFELAADFELWARFSRDATLHTVEAPIACFRHIEGQRSVALKDAYMDEVAEIRAREVGRSPSDRRATRLASAGLRATARSRALQTKVDSALGAPNKIVFDSETNRLRLRPPSAAAARAHRVFLRLSGSDR